MRLRKAIKAALVGGAAAVLASTLSATPAQASEVTPLDAYWLQQKGVGTWPTYQADTNSQATNYCNTIGFNNPNYVGSCRIIDFWEESRVAVPNYSKLASPERIWNCSPTSAASQSLSWSTTNSISHAVGVTITNSITINFKVKPFGVGVGGSMTMSVANDYTFSWGSSSTRTDSSTLTVGPRSTGVFDWYNYHGTAHGFYTVKIDYVRPGYGLTRPGTYKVLADLTADLPKPEDPTALSAQPVVGLVAKERPMTVAEVSGMCAGSTGTYRTAAR